MWMAIAGGGTFIRTPVDVAQAELREGEDKALHSTDLKREKGNYYAEWPVALAYRDASLDMFYNARAFMCTLHFLSVVQLQLASEKAHVCCLFLLSTSVLGSPLLTIKKRTNIYNLTLSSSSPFACVCVRACGCVPRLSPIVQDITSLDALTTSLRDEQKALVLAMSKEWALHGQVGPDLVKALTTLKD